MFLGFVLNDTDYDSPTITQCKTMEEQLEELRSSLKANMSIDAEVVNFEKDPENPNRISLVADTGEFCVGEIYEIPDDTKYVLFRYTCYDGVDIDYFLFKTYEEAHKLMSEYGDMFCEGHDLDYDFIEPMKSVIDTGEVWLVQLIYKVEE